jgi:hypothetical protein
MVHLIVGIDRATTAPWHQHVAAEDVATAVEIATARAREAAIDLVIAAVLGPYSSVLPYQER